MLAQNVIVWLWISFLVITIISTAYAAQRLLTQKPATMLPDRLLNYLWGVPTALWVISVTAYLTLIERLLIH